LKNQIISTQANLELFFFRREFLSGQFPGGAISQGPLIIGFDRSDRIAYFQVKLQLLVFQL
jgi:hypothetical protein